MTQQTHLQLAVGWGGLPRRHSGKESACQCRRPRFDPWVRKILWKRKWQLTPVFLPGISHGERSLVSYSPWGRQESAMTERLSTMMGWDPWSKAPPPWTAPVEEQGCRVAAAELNWLYRAATFERECENRVKMRQFPANVSAIHASLGSGSHLFNSLLSLSTLSKMLGVSRKAEDTDNYRYQVTRTETANHTDEKTEDL